MTVELSNAQLWTLFKHTQPDYSLMQDLKEYGRGVEGVYSGGRGFDSCKNLPPKQLLFIIEQCEQSGRAKDWYDPDKYSQLDEIKVN